MDDKADLVQLQSIKLGSWALHSDSSNDSYCDNTTNNKLVTKGDVIDNEID